MLNELRLGLRVAFVCAGGVRNHGGIKLLVETRGAVLAIRRSASLESFCAAARSCTAFTASRAWYSKSRSSGLEFLLHLSNFGLLLFPPFGGEMNFLFLDFLFASLQAQAFVFRFAQGRRESLSRKWPTSLSLCADFGARHFR